MIKEFIEQIGGRERLLQIIELCGDHNPEVATLARIALAVLDAKPVGMFMRGIEDEPVPGRIRYSHMIGEGANSPFCFPLYTTPPAASEPVSKGYALPDGWKLVPIEPTWGMLSADGCKEHPEGEKCLHHDNRRRIWAAMLAAAPAPGGDDASAPTTTNI
ncbi:hypothetical protein [Serratia proteamaculans]